MALDFPSSCHKYILNTAEGLSVLLSLVFPPSTDVIGDVFLIASVLLRIICQQHTWLQQWLHQIIWYRRLKDSPTQKHGQRESETEPQDMCLSALLLYPPLSVTSPQGGPFAQCSAKIFFFLTRWPCQTRTRYASQSLSAPCQPVSMFGAYSN